MTVTPTLCNLVATGRETALILLRAPGAHDSRVMREAETLRELGYRPLIVGVVSEQVRELRTVQDGTPIIRLAPTSPFAWIKSLMRRSDPAPAPTPSAAGGEEAPLMTAAIRLHRWLRTLDFYRRAIGIVRRTRPALIHCNDYNTMWIGRRRPREGGIGSSTTLMSSGPTGTCGPSRAGGCSPAKPCSSACAHVTITASPGYAEVMARRHRITKPKVVRNIPASRPGGAAKQVEDPVQASGGSNHSVALYVGSLTSGRGLETSIKAMALVPGARLKLLGPGRDDYRAGLVELARREGVAERVEFAGAVPPQELLGAISTASVGLALIQPVCLSYRMSLPNKLFEYVAAGVPVLGSDLPAIGSLVREHGIGLVAQPDQVADVASKLSEMLEPRRNAALRQATREAAKRLNWDRESRLLVDAYVEAATAAGQRPRR